MSDCLSDIQIEDVLAGQADPLAAEHAEYCTTCRSRIERARAMRRRLAGTFASVRAPADAADRVRQAIATSCVLASASAPEERLAASAAAPPPSRRARRWPMQRIGVLAAAAGLFLVAAVFVLFELGGPTQAAAASELVALHRQNLAGGHELVRHATAAESQQYLARQLGFEVSVPDEVGERRIRGCCVSRFLGRRAGNFVVDEPGRPISIIVSDTNSQPLEMGRKLSHNGRTYWVCQMDGFYTVAVQAGSLIYCAVGDAAPDHLVGLLDHILAQPTTGPQS